MGSGGAAQTVEFAHQERIGGASAFDRDRALDKVTRDRFATPDEGGVDVAAAENRGTVSPARFRACRERRDARCRVTDCGRRARRHVSVRPR